MFFIIFGLLGTMTMVFCCLFREDNSTVRYITWIPCYLCCEKIPIKHWDTHRKVCADKYEKVLAMRHPLEPNMICNKCSGYLRKWTSYRMKQLSGNNTFICDIHHTNLDANKRYPKLRLSILIITGSIAFCVTGICATLVRRRRIKKEGS